MPYSEKQNVIVVIPARYRSTRYPGKPLVSLLGKPMILWVAELSAKAVGRDSVYVATDDARIVEAVQDAGFNVVITSSGARTGTDRLAEVASQIDAELYINVQGDEPLVDPEDIRAVIDAARKNPGMVVNGYAPLEQSEDPSNVNVPKVIFTEDQRLIYMSRSVVPGYKVTESAPEKFYKQVCIYAFNREHLLRYAAFGRKSALEHSEDIEILRFLEWGQAVLMHPTNPGSLAVDVPEDVVRVELALKAKQEDL